jgi:DNA-binding transcriptional ArsR family regulator
LEKEDILRSLLAPSMPAQTRVWACVEIADGADTTMAAIAAALTMSKRTVRMHLAALRDAQLLTISRTGRGIRLQTAAPTFVHLPSFTSAATAILADLQQSNPPAPASRPAPPVTPPPPSAPPLLPAAAVEPALAAAVATIQLELDRLPALHGRFSYDDLRAIALEFGDQLDLQIEASKFVSWLRSSAPKARKKLKDANTDWPRAFRDHVSYSPALGGQKRNARRPAARDSAAPATAAAAPPNSAPAYTEAEMDAAWARLSDEQRHALIQCLKDDSLRIYGPDSIILAKTNFTDVARYQAAASWARTQREHRSAK